jgi:hypothetical protein
MKSKDKIKLRGRVLIRLFGPDGRLKEERDIRNLVVTAGLGWIAGRLKYTADVPTQMGYMAVGDDNTAAAAGQTALVGSELGRVAMDSNPTSAGAVVSYIATFPAGTGTGAIVEAAILNAAAAGTMLCRTVFAVVNKAASDSMTITWDLTISAA